MAAIAKPKASVQTMKRRQKSGDLRIVPSINFRLRVLKEVNHCSSKLNGVSFVNHSYNRLIILEKLKMNFL